MSERRIALSDLAYGPEEEAAVRRVVRSRWLSTGPEVAAFEREFAQMVGSPHAIAVGSGTAAIHLAYLALGIGPGDEVIQPTLNFVAAANLTLAVGARPRLADVISSDEPTIDPACIEALINERTRAVMVMHYAGYLCRMAEITDLCRSHGLPIIEDACHAVGARYLDPGGREPHGRMAGDLGVTAAFSFFSNKNLAVGEGGMLVTRDDQVAAGVRLLRSHGMTTLSWERDRGHASSYDVLRPGFNYRFDEIRAALGRVQLAKLAANNTRRRELVAAYRDALAALAGWTVPFADYSGDSAHHLMVVLAPDREQRDQAVRRLNRRGIQTSLHYPLIGAFSAYQGRPLEPAVRAADFVARAITLPLHPGLTATQVGEICAVLSDHSP